MSEKPGKWGVLADIKEGRAAAADGDILYPLSVVFGIKILKIDSESKKREEL